jgi:DNA-binding transcriptional LysR family regulator
MDIQQLRNFLVLCEILNFRKAAEKVNMVKPALSRQIQLLKKKWGIAF